MCRVARLFYVQTVTLFAIQRISLIYILALKRGINKTWIGLDQINLCNLLNHSRLGDRVTGVELIWFNPGFAAVHKTATLHLGMWKTGKCQHLYTCIFMYFSPILLLLLVPFFHLLAFHFALQLIIISFHENADECLTIDFLREVPVGSEL